MEKFYDSELKSEDKILCSFLQVHSKTKITMATFLIKKVG